MKKKLYRSLAWALTLCMAMALLPATAFAVGGAGELSISGGTTGNDYSVSDGAVRILSGTTMTISGTTTTEHIVVGDGVTANLIFSGVSITAADDCPVTVEAGGTLNLTLTGENSLTATASESMVRAALNVQRTIEGSVEKVASLVIDGTGSLSAIGSLNSSTYSCGIGTNGYLSDEDAAGATTIAGGTIKAVGRAVGIGGKNADIAITGGTVTAIGLGNVTDSVMGSQYGVGIGGAGCDVSISGTGTVVNAYGSYNGIGDAEYWDMNENAPININIQNGEVTAWSACTIGDAPDYTVTYSSNYTQNGRKYGIGGASGTISITGGNIDARGYVYGIGGDGITGIIISNANVDAYSGETSGNGYGIGGNMAAGTVRNITISGTATVGVWMNENHNYGAIIGGGDNSGSTITIKDNAVVKNATDIGSSGFDAESTGFAGGTIEILNSASIQNPEATYSPSARHIGGSDVYYGNGGAGGDITINTTGTVFAESIGGGTGDNGGAGGDITILSGNVLTNHIGGGDGRGYDYGTNAATGIGGNGGNVNISGGTVGEYSGGGNTPSGSTNEKTGSGENSFYYSAAGIGGGGGTQIGGNGGAITISGGKVYAISGVTVYDPSTGNTVSEGGSGTGVGGAGIGGGNGADGGTINISGGYVDVSGAMILPYDAASATAVPALIGGGSAGGAGQITISGGYVNSSISPYNAPVYGGDATSIGQGKGATNAGGFVKVTGGTFYTSPNAYENPNEMTNPVAQPKPWPTAADGSSPVYMANFNFYSADNMPDGLNLTNCPIVSMTLRDKATEQVYSYGTKDMINDGFFWLPVGDTSDWGYHQELYTIELKIKKDNTVYAFDGTVYYNENENIIGGIMGSTDLTYRGEVIETLQLTSDWGNQTKTYNGTDQKPVFTVKNMDGDVLTKDVDYTLDIEFAHNGTSGTGTTVTEIKNSGGYIVTATGNDGTDYEGMAATLDEFWINPRHINASYSGGSFTKEYDGTTDVYQGETEVTSLAMTVNSGDFCDGDVLTNIIAENPRYESSNVGSNIAITANSPSYTYTKNGTPCNIYNYAIDLPVITGDITVKVIGETNLNASGVTVIKVYDGTDNCSLASVSGNVVLEDLVGTEVATVSITGVSAFNSAQAGTGRTVTLTIGDLSGVNAENYTLAGGVSTIEVTAAITPADYAYNLTQAQQAQEFTQNGGIDQIILPQTANGINGETVTGTVTLWHDAACTANQATNDSVNALTIGEHSLYVKFVPDGSETNYTNKVTTGKVVVLTVVEGDPQEISFTQSGPLVMSYGDPTFINAAVNASTSGSALTYSSGNTSVAEVDASTGAVIIKGAGTAIITAVAEAVEGLYRRTSADYTLTVAKKDITVVAANASRQFKQANPEFNILVEDGTLVAGDSIADLAATLVTTATAASGAGTYPITGISSSANYNVNVTPGVLTITKADAPSAEDIRKSLLYSAEYNDVTVNIAGLPSDRGTTSFSSGSVTGDTGIINGEVTDTTGGIRFSTFAGDENQTVTIPVTVTMQNYENVTLNVIVTLVDKTPVTITGVSVANKTYDGIAAIYAGTPVNGQEYIGDYEYVWSSVTAPKDAGSYILTVKIPEDNAEYMGEMEIPFTISPKAMTVKPRNINIYTGETLPVAFELVYEGIVTGDTIIPSGNSPVFELKNGENALENSNTNGSYTILWTNKEAVSVEHNNYSISKADGTLTISNRHTSGGGGSSTPATPNIPTGSSVSTSDGISTATVEAQVRTSGTTASASVSNDTIKAAIEAAEKAAAENKTPSSVEIKANTPAGATEIEFSIPKTALAAFAGSKSETLSLVSGIGEIKMNIQTAASISEQAGGSDIVMSVGLVDTKQALNAQQQAAVSDAPVYDISITSGGSRITGFGGGTITVSLPYVLKEGEDPSGVVVWYLDAQGNIQNVESVYDAKTGTVTFTTNHLSLYAVGYDEFALWSNPFTDVSKDAWYYNAARFVNQHGMMSGTTNTAFSPDMATTRGMVVTILYRLEGSATTSGTSFTDVASGAWYADAVAWAVENGIAAGYGGGRFGPEDSITREQMAVMLINYAKLKGYNTTNAVEGSLSSFNDVSTVSSWANDAMQWAVSKGLIGGKSDGLLDPRADAARSQVAAVLMRFCEMTEK